MDAIDCKGLIFIFILVVSMLPVQAITATLMTGGVKININETPHIYEKSIGVRNDNNSTIYVFFQPAKDIEHMISMDRYNISLEKGEQRFIKFRINITENKFYDSRIVALFSADSSLNITDEVSFDKLAMEMKVMIAPSANLSTGKNQTGQSPAIDGKVKGRFSIAFLVGGVILAVIVVAMAWMFIRSSKRGDNDKRKKD